MLTRRNKDGEGNGGDRTSKKIITDSPESFDEALSTLVEYALSNRQNVYRIYSTVDARDFDKGIREFKRRQLEADYADNRGRHGFYRDGFNRVVSCLQQPGARASSLFLWDCDSTEEYQNTNRLLQELSVEHTPGPLGLHIGRYNIRDAYETKNGGHIITDPFNYPKIVPPEYHKLIQKNAMMLWAY